MAWGPDSSAVFDLSTERYPAGRLAVVSFRGHEEVSKPFSFEILVTAIGIDNVSLEQDLLGERACLFLRGEGASGRAVHGILRRVEAEGISGAAEEQHHYRLWLAPRLWLLGRNKNSRIFQDQSIRDIVEQILRESHVPCRFNLVRTLAPRGYCVQYQESDLRFVERLLAEEGLYYFFDHPDDEREEETVVFTDEVRLAEPIAGDPVLPFHDSGGMVEREQDIRRFQVGHRVRPRTNLLREFDWTRPSLNRAAAAEVREDGQISAVTSAAVPGGMAPGGMSSGGMAPGGMSPGGMGAGGMSPGAMSSGGMAPGGMGSGAVASDVMAFVAGAPALAGLGSAQAGSSLHSGTQALRVYDHHGEFEGEALDGAAATRHLEQHRARAVIAEAESRCRRLLPGRWFELQEAALPSHDGRYLVLRVEHEGHQPETLRATNREPREVYKNRAWCVPANVAYRPRRPRRKIQQAMETATVVGPAGQEIHTDEHGRIKVQFHWDLHGRRNEHSSCWVRVMQAWAGTGWGFQFIPRIGMEVIVTFAGGDTDRPMVLGCVYNAEHPVPFPLPREKTKSGIRTQSSRGGGGFNEISFEDRTGRELLYAHAQKDLETVALNNHTARVGVHMTEQVGANRFSVVGGTQLDVISGNLTRSVGGDEKTTTDGSRDDTVHGDVRAAIDGQLQHRVTQDVHSEIRGEHRHTAVGEMRWEAVNDVLLRVRGSLVNVVGTNDAPRSYALHVEGHSKSFSTDEMELESDKAITLTCGDSYIRIAPQTIEVCSPKVVVRGKGGEISLADDKVKLRAKSLIGAKSDDKVALFGSGAHVVLTADAKIDGSNVKLKASDSSWDDEEAEEGEVTTIELVDDDGNPIPNQRFRIYLDGGAELSGVLDHEGKAKVRFQGSGEIVFPDLGKVESA